MRAGAETWYALCEQLRAGFTYTSNCPLPPLTFRPKTAASPPPLLDVNMADSPAVSTPTAGQKRSREDDEGEEVGWDFDLRAEKVGFNTALLV